MNAQVSIGGRVRFHEVDFARVWSPAANARSRIVDAYAIASAEVCPFGPRVISARRSSVGSDEAPTATVKSSLFSSVCSADADEACASGATAAASPGIGDADETGAAGTSAVSGASEEIVGVAALCRWVLGSRTGQIRRRRLA